MDVNELIVVLLGRRLAYRSVNPRRVERLFQPFQRCAIYPSTVDLRDLPSRWRGGLRSPSREEFCTLEVVLEPRLRLAKSQ